MYLTRFLNSFIISSSSFLVDSSWLFLCKIMLSANRDSLNSPFPIWMPFMSFSCLITSSRILVEYWIELVRGDHRVLCCDPLGKKFNPSPLGMILTVAIFPSFKNLSWFCVENSFSTLYICKYRPLSLGNTFNSVTLFLFMTRLQAVQRGTKHKTWDAKHPCDAFLTSLTCVENGTRNQVFWAFTL